MRVSPLPSDFPLPVTVAKNKRHEYIFLKVKAHSLCSSAKLNAAEKNMFLMHEKKNNFHMFLFKKNANRTFVFFYSRSFPRRRVVLFFIIFILDVLFSINIFAS